MRAGPHGGDVGGHGRRHGGKLEAELGGQDVDPFGTTRVGFEAQGEISRKDFGLTWNMPLETGGLLVGEEVRFSVDTEAVKVKEAVAQ